MLTALIMAGGKGTRFWPLSTEEKPKQFLNITGEKTMIQMTIDRIKKIIPIQNIFVCTTLEYKNILMKQIPELDKDNIILEPESRNTNSCIILSTLYIKRKFSDANILVLPSDHLIRDEKEFLNIIQISNQYLNLNKSKIVTLGIKPNRPETGYGYIKIGYDSEKIQNYEFKKVESFVEKPNLDNAIKYVKCQEYLWNAGMFMWNIDTILNEAKKYSANTYDILREIKNIKYNLINNFVKENYAKTEKISIDYSILEKSKNIVVIPSDFGWDDIGTWESVERFNEKDKNGNIKIGNIVSLESENNVAISSNNKIIINKLSNIYIVENNGIIVVGKKSDISSIQNIKERI